MGATRVVVGSAAIGQDDLVARLVHALGRERVVAAVDVRDGVALGEAWRPGAEGVPPLTLIERLFDVGVRTFEVTAVDRDGSLEGPDLPLLGTVVEAFARLERSIGGGREDGLSSATGVIASGGIRSIDDLRAVRDLGCGGAIVGRALLEGRLDLAAATDALSRS
jgi:phosphoribosylformimino-5-aminoimidazole carboxamide ribotide isomerase